MCVLSKLSLDICETDPHFDLLQKLNVDDNVTLNDHCKYIEYSELSCLNKSKLSVLHVNIRSLVRNIDILRDFPDIILLCETWLHSNNIGKCNING